MNIGAHVSIAGGVFNAPENAYKIGCECFQIFTRSPRGGQAPVLTDKIVADFKATMKKYKLKNIYVHAPYFINFASPKLYMKRIIFTNDRKFFKLNNVLLVVLSFVLVSISVLPANAANLNLISQTNEIGVDSQFQIDLMLDAEGQDINAIEGNITFPKNLLEIKEIYTGNSIINFWIEKPQINAEIKIAVQRKDRFNRPPQDLLFISPSL